MTAMLGEWVASAVRRCARAGGAVFVVFAVTWFLFFMVSQDGWRAAWFLLDHVTPTVSGETHNVNTSLSGGNLLVLPICLCGGLFVGAIIWDPKVSTQTEAALSFAIFILLAGVSGVNFWKEDALISVNAQTVIDFVLSAAALAVIGFTAQWRSSRISIVAIQRILLFTITLYGFTLPLYYGSVLLLLRLGYDMRSTELPDWLKFAGAVLGLAAAVGPSLVKLRPRASRDLANAPPARKATK